MQYRRARVAGGTFFFTVNLANRNSDTLARYYDALRSVVHKVKQAHPLSIVAMVVLPDHLHTIWRFSEGDAYYPKRWSLIKIVGCVGTVGLPSSAQPTGGNVNYSS